MLSQIEESDKIAKELHETRILIFVNLVSANDDCISASAREDLEWDLWVVHGLLEYGYPLADL